MASILSPGQSASLISSPDNSTGEPFALAQGESEDLSKLLDAFAKSYYSTVMWDLNFNNNNVFGDEEVTQYLISTINNATGNQTIVLDSSSVLGSSKLIGSPARFEIQYICSIPRKKDTGSLTISVLVSNIVLLSVFWNLFNWIAIRYLRRHDPTWDICQGCLQHDKRLIAQRNEGIMRMDQDPLCQNVDTDQETLYSNYSGPEPDWKIWNKLGKVGHSISTKSSQKTLRTVSGGDVYALSDGVEEYRSHS